MENTTQARNEALNAIYDLIKFNADMSGSSNSLDNAKAIDLLCHAASQLESIDTASRSTQALMDMYKSLDSYKNNGFNGMAGYCLNKEN